jgi:hypothetical protein
MPPQAAAGGSEPSDAIRAVNALLTQLDALRHHPNVMVLTTSNITEAIDLAFVDRADIKAGPVCWMHLLGASAGCTCWGAAAECMGCLPATTPLPQQAAAPGLHIMLHDARPGCAATPLWQPRSTFAARTGACVPVTAGLHWPAWRACTLRDPEILHAGAGAGGRGGR